MKYEREVSLDVFRGFAIILVVFYHFGLPAGVFYPLEFLQYPAIRFGWVGVDIFFVLSGFLVGRLLLRYMGSNESGGVSRFLVRRAFKIWPVYFSYLLARAIFDSDPLENYLIQNLLHIQNYAGTSVKHSWSLAVEEHFYLLLPLSLTILRSREAYSPLNTIRLAIVVLFSCLVFRVFATINDVDAVAIQWQTHYRIDGLMFGVLLAVLVEHYPTVYAKLERSSTLLLSTVVLSVLSLIYFDEHAELKQTLGYSLNYLGAGALLIFLRRSELYLKKNHVAKVLALVGLYSYAIYLWHLALFKVSKALFASVIGFFDMQENILAVYLFGYLVILFGGVVITLAIERPFLHIRDRFFRA